MALCECSCGQDAGYFNRTKSYIGIKKGDPRRFINGHNTRKLSSEEQSRRGNFNDGSKLRNIPKKHGNSYIKFKHIHLHRLIAEKKLGRKLIKGEIVHHIDGNKKNNNIDNLEVMTQSEHARKHSLDYHNKRKLRGANI